MSVRPVLLGLLLAPASLSALQAPALADRFDFERRHDRFDLPSSLEEVSGLASTPDGRLFGHADEEAVLHEIDPFDGRIVKRFRLGNPAAPGDFEGLAVAGERIFLITSGGWLYETREAPDGAQAPYRVTDTRLGSGCEVEGLAYHAPSDALLVACKTSRNTGAQRVALIHRLPLSPDVDRPPPIVVPWVELAAFGVDPELHPSAVEVDPVTGRILVVAAREGLLVDLDDGGRVHAVVRLPRRRHRQPEGLTFRSDGALLVADEGAGGRGRLTVYGPPSGGP